MIHCPGHIHTRAGHPLIQESFSICWGLKDSSFKLFKKLTMNPCKYMMFLEKEEIPKNLLIILSSHQGWMNNIIVPHSMLGVSSRGHKRSVVLPQATKGVSSVLASPWRASITIWTAVPGAGCLLSKEEKHHFQITVYSIHTQNPQKG